ncbi:hypothetical protein Tco_1384831 [Tanacetum coccineum]
MVANQIRPPGFPPIQNNQNRFNQNQGNNFNQKSEEQFQLKKTVEITSTKDKFINLRLVNHRFTKLTLIKLPLHKCKVLSSTITNPKEDLKGITTRSGVVYQGPMIPTTSSPKVVERRTEVTKDTVFPTNNGITEDVQPPVVPVENQNPVSEPVDAPVSAPMPNPKPSIPYPSRRNDEKRRENANEQIEKFYEIFKDMSFEISFMDALTLMPKFASTLKALIGNKEKLKADAFLALADDPTSPEVDESYYDPKGDILILEALLNSDPSPFPTRWKNYLPEIREMELKILKQELPNLQLMNLPRLNLGLTRLISNMHFFEDNNKFPDIIAKDLLSYEKGRSLKGSKAP